MSSRPCRCSKNQEDSSTSTTREDALSHYMQVARGRAKQAVSGKQVGGSQRATDPLVGQVLINIGRMEYDLVKAKGILDKSFTPSKIPIHRDASYSDVLSKCIEYVWGEPSSDYNYYLADGGGACIGSDEFKVRSSDGTDSVLPWTLKNYLQVSSVRYPSRMRIYCVRQLKSDDEEPAVDSTADSTSDGGDDESTTSIEKEPPGYFEVIFEVPKQSRYRPLSSFRSASQQEYLYNGEIDDERTMDVRSIVDANPSKYRLFPYNPISEGCFLRSIIQGEKELYFIKNLDFQGGKAEYEQPANGATFDVWTGCYLCDSLALLACVAVNGYHGVASYSWLRDDDDGAGSIGATPLLYCSSKATYLCTVTYGSFFIRCTFKVKENEVEMVKKEEKVKGEVTEAPPPSSQPPEILKCGLASTELAESLPEPPLTADQSSPAGKELDQELGFIMKSCDDPDKLQLISVIGSGAFGQVHKAVWRGTVVAAKVIMLAGNKKIVDNELDAYKTLHHPNILNFIGIIQERTRIVIMTNFVNGNNLYELLHCSSTNIKLSYSRKLDISIQICQALVYMHGCNPAIVHLDLKPENVLVERGSFHIFLADFGLGRLLTSCLNPGRTTMQAGTPAFQPPEQLRGEMLGMGTDTYAAACIIAELFGERPVWQNLPPHTIILKVASGQYPTTQHLPSPIAAIVKKCFVPAEERLQAAALLKSICELR